MLYRDDLANSHNYTNLHCSWRLTGRVPCLSGQGKGKRATAMKHVTQKGACPSGEKS